MSNKGIVNIKISENSLKKILVLGIKNKEVIFFSEVLRKYISFLVYKTKVLEFKLLKLN